MGKKKKSLLVLLTIFLLLLIFFVTGLLNELATTKTQPTQIQTSKYEFNSLTLKQKAPPPPAPIIIIPNYNQTFENNSNFISMSSLNNALLFSFSDTKGKLHLFINQGNWLSLLEYSEDKNPVYYPSLSTNQESIYLSFFSLEKIPSVKTLVLNNQNTQTLPNINLSSCRKIKGIFLNDTYYLFALTDDSSKMRIFKFIKGLWKEILYHTDSDPIDFDVVVYGNNLLLSTIGANNLYRISNLIIDSKDQTTQLNDAILSQQYTGDLSLFCYQGTPYLAYVSFENYTSSYKASVQKLKNNSWEILGDPYINKGRTRFSSLLVDKNIPYLAYSNIDNGTIGVVGFNGTTWELASPPFKGSADKLCFASLNNKLIIGYLDKNDGSLPKTIELLKK